MYAKIPSIARRALALAAGAAFGLALSAPAAAQPYGDRYENDPSTMSGIVVTAPPSSERDSVTGAPIEWVSASRVVRYGDLDLNRHWDRRELRARIVRAARSACGELDAAYPVTAADSPPCVRAAVRRAAYEFPTDY